MQQAVAFLFGTLFNLYIGAVLLRLLLQYVRADYRNPISQFIVRITSPLVMPLRRRLPPLGKLDTATAVVLIALELLAAYALVSLDCMRSPDIFQTIQIAGLRIIYLTLRVYLFAIFIYVILSWISPGTYNPATGLLSAIVEPVMAPVRRLIPPIGGLDLTPLFVLLGIQSVIMVLPLVRSLAGLGCTSFGLIF